MYKLHLIFIITFLSISLMVSGQSQWVPFTSPTPQNVEVSLIESDNASVEFNVSVGGMYEFDTTVLSTTFDRVSIPGAGSGTTIGSPEMPFVRQLIAIPECDDVSLSINVTGTLNFSNYNIYPAPDYVEVYSPDSILILEESFSYDTNAYQQNQNYPTISAEIKSTGYFRDQKYAEVYIYPLQFNPVTGNLSVNTDYELSLNFTNPSGPVNENTGIFNNVATNVFLNYVSSGITASINDRPGHTGTVSWIDITSPSQASTIVGDYLIITEDEFWDPAGQESDLVKIANHRAEYNGFDVAIVHALDVKEYFTIEGEPYEYERAFRRFIDAVYDGENANHTYDGKLGYVLLVSDPIEYTNYGIPASYEHHEPTYTTYPPNDYYYSCMINENGVADMFGDLFIGRFSVSEQFELTNIIDKTIRFETHFKSGSGSNNFHFAYSQGLGSGTGYLDNLAIIKSNLDNYIDDPFSTSVYNAIDHQLEERSIEFVNTINSENLFVYFFGHSSDNYYSLGEADTDNHCTIEFLKNHLANNNNPFVVNYSCKSGFYTSPSIDCLAEEMLYYSSDHGYVGCLAAPLMKAIGQIKHPSTTINNPPLHIIEGYLQYAIHEHLSHIAGEFILEGKINSGIICERWNLNYLGDPALNLMAEGFEISQPDFTFDCPQTIGTEVYVREGADVTIPKDCNINFIGDGKLVIDYGAEIIIGCGSEISGMSTSNAIDVYGDIYFTYMHAPITFTAPEGHYWRGLSISNPNLSLTMDRPMIFENCSFKTFVDELTIEPYYQNDRNSFVNASFLSSYGSVNINKTDFTNTEVQILQPQDEYSTIEVQNCTFQNDDNVYYASLLIEQYDHYIIHDNTIEFSVGDGIIIFNCGNLGELDLVTNIEDNTITFTGASPSNNCGIKVFRSIADIKNNHIRSCDYGIVGMNNSIINVEGDPEALTNSDTQIIEDNNTNQMYFANNSFPGLISYNVINRNNQNPLIYPYIYNDASPPFGQLFDVTNNCWDGGSPGIGDLMPANAYEWSPIWCPGTSTTIQQTPEEIIYESAMLNSEVGDYTTAESEFKEIITDYPETETAKNAVKQLFELERVNGQDYQSLKSYYENEPNLQNNNSLGKLTDWMISYCDVELANYENAIDWYDNVIDTTSSESDSTFAAIDMGEVYIAMGSGKTLLNCNNGQFLFESENDFKKNRKFLIDELLKSHKNSIGKDQDPGTSSSKGCAIMSQNIPNPFSSSTTIDVEVYTECNIELVISDNLGKNIVSLAKGSYDPGKYSFTLNRSTFESGIYFYSLLINGTRCEVKKMVIF